MILTQDFKWSPDGVRIETVRAGEYGHGELPERACEIAVQLGITAEKTSQKPELTEKPKASRKREDKK